MSHSKLWWETVQKDCWKTEVGKVGNHTFLRTAEKIWGMFKECVTSERKKTHFACALGRCLETFGDWKHNGRLLKNMYCLDFKLQTRERESIFQEKTKATQSKGI